MEELFSIGTSFSLSFLLSVLGGLPLFYFSVDDPANTLIVGACVFVSTFGIMSSFMLVYLINPLTFPSSFLSASMGASNMTARMITILAPIIAEVPRPVPLAVYTVSAFLALSLTYFISVPEDMEELLGNVKRAKEEREKLVGEGYVSSDGYSTAAVESEKEKGKS